MQNGKTNTSLLRNGLARLTAGIIMIMACGLASVSFAEVDLTGDWAALYHEDIEDRLPGPELGDYTGLPITEAARLRSDTWDASMYSVLEHQCKPHPAGYVMRGPSNMRWWRDIDLLTQEVTAYHMVIEWLTPTRTIWMDGRPHPSRNARHTWEGFSTGRWDGDTLIVETTHMKAGYLRRIGMPYSDQTTMKEYFRRHGDYLNYVSIVYDPIYMTEPLIKSTNWRFDPGHQLTPMTCRPTAELDKDPDWIPVRGPEQGMLDSIEFSERWGIPLDLVRGGAASMYPGDEYPNFEASQE